MEDKSPALDADRTKPDISCAKAMAMMAETARAALAGTNAEIIDGMFAAVDEFITDARSAGFVNLKPW